MQPAGRWFCQHGPGPEVMVGKQLGFSGYELTTAKKQTKLEKFLVEMEVVLP